MTSDPTATPSPEAVREEEGAEELGEELARADLTARWFIRSGMRPPSEDHQRAVMLAAEELPRDDVDAPGAPMPPTPPTPPAAGSR